MLIGTGSKNFGRLRNLMKNPAVKPVGWASSGCLKTRIKRRIGTFGFCFLLLTELRGNLKDRPSPGKRKNSSRPSLYVVVHELRPESIGIGNEQRAGYRSNEHRAISLAQDLSFCCPNSRHDNIDISCHEQ